MQKKLSKRDRHDLQSILDDALFTGGAQLQDLDLPEQLLGVYTREMSCEEPIEKLYYSVKYKPMCVLCRRKCKSSCKRLLSSV